MGFCRVFFGLTLVIRAAFHLLIAGLAAMDLKQIFDKTSGTLTQITLKLTHADEFVREFEFPLEFYIFCGAGLFVLTCAYPWRSTGRNNFTVYAIIHALYVGIVVYVVFIRGIVDLSRLREEYKILNTPGLFPASLVLDVLTFVAALASSGKGSDGASYSSIFPLHRVMVFSASSVRDQPSVASLPPYTKFQNSDSDPRQQSHA